MKKALAIAAILCLLTGGAFAAETGNPYALPLDIAVGGYAPNPAGFTEDGYQDDSLTVKTEVREVNGVRFFLIWATVKSPTQLRTAIAGEPNEVVDDLPSRMVRGKNAVVVVNGEFYVQRVRNSIIYRQGVMFRNEPDPAKDVLIIDEKGDFYVFTSEEKEAEIEQFVADGHTIIDAFSFGPALVNDGKTIDIRDDYYFNNHERLPRTAIAQVAPLSYVFVEALGRTVRSMGCTHQDMADFMGSLGVRVAYNIDGGNSCLLMFNGKYFDEKTRNTERRQSDVIYVTSAVDPATWR